MNKLKNTSVMVQYYFKKKRSKGSYSFVEVISSEAAIAGLVSFLYYTIGLPGKWSSRSAILTGAFFAVFVVSTLIAIYQEYMKERRINILTVLAALIGTVMCVVSFTCLDRFLL